MKIFIKTSKDSGFCVEIDGNKSVGDLKMIIHEQLLIYSGKALDDDMQILKDIPLAENCVVCVFNEEEINDVSKEKHSNSQGEEEKDFYPDTDSAEYSIQRTAVGMRCVFKSNNRRPIFLNRAIRNTDSAVVFVWIINAEYGQFTIGFAPSGEINKYLESSSSLEGRRLTSFDVGIFEERVTVDLKGVQEPPPTWSDVFKLGNPVLIEVQADAYSHTLSLYINHRKVPYIISFFRLKLPFHVWVSGQMGSAFTSVKFKPLEEEMEGTGKAFIAELSK